MALGVVLDHRLPPIKEVEGQLHIIGNGNVLNLLFEGFCVVFRKLKDNQPLTHADVKVLEEILWSEIGTKQDYESEYGSKPLGEFVREIVGLDMNAAKEAFAEYLNDTSLDSRQIYFVNQIVEYVVHNGLMKDLVIQE